MNQEEEQTNLDKLYINHRLKTKEEQSKQLPLPQQGAVPDRIH